MFYHFTVPCLARACPSYHTKSSIIHEFNNLRFGGAYMLTVMRLKELLDHCPAEATLCAYDAPDAGSSDCWITLLLPTGGTRWIRAGANDEMDTFTDAGEA